MLVITDMCLKVHGYCAAVQTKGYIDSSLSSSLKSLIDSIFTQLHSYVSPKRDGVMGGWRKLHNEELHNLYSSPSIIRIIKSRRMRWVGHVARMGEKRNMCWLLVGKPEGKRSLGRPRCRWIDNIKMNPLEIGLNVVDWIGLTQDQYRWRALVNAVMKLWVPSNAGKLPSGCTTCGRSSGTQLHRVSYPYFSQWHVTCAEGLAS
jgi:hypothetical protein